MLFACDFDGVVVEMGDYDDVTSPLRLRPGAVEGLRALRAAGHRLLLWSGRSSRSLLVDPTLDPLVRAGARHVNRPEWERNRALNRARYEQMVRFVNEKLSGVFAAVDDGLGGKPNVDLFIDDRAIRYGDGAYAMSWFEIITRYGAGYAPGAPLPTPPAPPAAPLRPPYAVLRGRFAAPGGPPGAAVRTLRETAVGPELLVSLPGSPVVCLLAGQHGEEGAGPVAFFQYLDQILAFAARRGVGLWIFPCVNPEGYDRDERRNLRGQRPSNVFMEYKIGDVWSGVLLPGQDYSETRRAQKQPDETAAVDQYLTPLPPPAYVLDIHQDGELAPGEFYAFVYGRHEPYAEIARSSPLARPHVGPVETKSWVGVDAGIETDENGLCEFHDGSVTDWLWFRGARMSVCLETACATPIDQAAATNLAWILGTIRAAAFGATAR